MKNAYCDSLLNEIMARSSELTENYTVDTVFIGGGTPSVLPPVSVYNIMKKVYNCFNISEKPEITIECNPGTLNHEKLQMYKEAGINRLSIGLQSADDNELKMLGRIHTYSQFEENYSLARTMEFNNINIDIMSALPGQTREGYLCTLEKVVKLEPEHISAYSLMVEENTPMYDMVYGNTEGAYATAGTEKECHKGASKKMILPDEDTEREMYYDTERKLGMAGYERYEISNYAKPGFECRHNTGYWKRVDYIGFGIGAASLINETRFSNCRDIVRYINNSSSPKEITENKEALTEEEQMEEFMFLGLRLKEGILKSEFKKSFGVEYDEVYGNVNDDLVKKGLLTNEGDKICLTKMGTDVSNYALSFFIM